VSGSDSSRRVALVLDTSAILAYAAGSMHVHELLHLEQVVTAQPDWHTDADLFDSWAICLNGREDAAAAAVLTYRYAAGLLTGEPDLYAIGGLRPDWVIPTDGA
jgi:hypothetical protein